MVYAVGRFFAALLGGEYVLLLNAQGERGYACSGVGAFSSICGVCMWGGGGGRYVCMWRTLIESLPPKEHKLYLFCDN